MAKFIKPGFLSIKMFEEDDKDWTTAELTRKEYFDLVDKIFSLKEIVKELKASEKTLLNEKNYYENKYNRINNEYQNKLDQLEEFEKNSTQISKKLTELSEENLILKKQNNNLMRIHKENANAKRGLTPKKSHHGYIKKRAEEYIYKFTHKNSNSYSKQKILTGSIKSWKNLIQTPYSLGLSATEVKELIENDLNNFKINLVNFKDKTKEEITNYLDNSKDIIVIYEMKLKENIHQNLWEFEALSYKQFILEK